MDEIKFTSQQEEPEPHSCGSDPEVFVIEDSPPIEKKRRKESSKVGAASYSTSFKKSFVEDFDHIGEIPSDSHKFRCTLCAKTLSCGHMGVGDIKRHISSSNHQRLLKELTQKSAQTKLNGSKYESIVAELRAVNMICKRNLPLSFGDDLGDFVRSNFERDSRAKEFTSGRTKTTALVGCLADDCRSRLVQKMTSGPYAIFTDGSNDNGLRKMYPLTVCVPDADSASGVSIEFLDMCTGTSGTAEAMYSSMMDTFAQYSIPTANMVAIGLDNTNSNMGSHNSVKSRLTTDNPSVYVSGCVCHIIHNAAGKGGLKLQELWMDVEDLVSDIYGHFNHSTPRKLELVEFCQFVDIEYRQMLKHVCTRWLSLHRVLERILQMFEALKSYFISSDLKDGKVKRIKKYFSDPLTEVYLLAIHSFTSLLTDANTKLQTSSPMIHRLQPICNDLVTSCLLRFCRADCVSDVEDMDNIPRLEGEDVRVGFATKQRLRQLKSAGDISDTSEERFYQNIVVYMEAITSYLLSNLPLTDDHLTTLLWLNPEEYVEANVEDILQCAFRYMKIFKFTDNEMDILQDQAILLKTHRGLSNLIQQYKDSGEVVKFWWEIGQLDSARFGLLSKVAIAMCLTPHSNAVAERIFSMIGKNLTAARKSLNKDQTLNNIMIVKCAGLANNFSPSEELKRKAKSATRISLLHSV